MAFRPTLQETSDETAESGAISEDVSSVHLEISIESKLEGIRAVSFIPGDHSYLERSLMRDMCALQKRLR